MQDLNKINSAQLFTLWKNLSLGLLIVFLTMLIAQLLSYLFAPVVALISAAVLYTIMYNSKVSGSNQCMIVVYGLFFCMVSYSLVSIFSNMLYIWGYIDLPKELFFFASPYIPSLMLDPICALTLLVIFIRINKLKICINCKIHNGLPVDRGRFGDILYRETRLQLINLIVLFTSLSIIVWFYYEHFYDKNTGINDRDSYIFSTLNQVLIVIDELYFAIRYYNIYLDFKESGDIITEDELSNMTTKTYLRIYLICGNDIYLNPHVVDPIQPYRQIIDTPFITKRNVNGITTSEVSQIVRRMVGNDGQLRFFYGRKNPDLQHHSLLRYFYFLNGNSDEYDDIQVSGEWMKFSRLVNIYNQNPNLLSRTLLGDMSRMTTVVLTQKIFDENGFRKVKVKKYVPTYDLMEIRNSDYDFQDDKWIRIAMFNSDTRGFFFKRMWKKLIRQKTDAKWQNKG